MGDSNESMPYTLSMDESYQLTRSGELGENLTWVFINNGEQVLGRNAQNELKYTYYDNSDGEEYVCYLEQWAGNRYVRVSNYVAYRVGTNYQGPIITSKPSMVVLIDEPFPGYQITATNSPESFAAEGLPPGLTMDESGYIAGMPTQLGNYLTTIGATNENDTGTATLNIFVVDGNNGGGSLNEFTLAIDDNYRVTRSENTTQSLTWVVKQNGSTVLERNALGDTHYTYYRNFSNRTHTIHLARFGTRVSNIVAYTPPLSVSNLSVYNSGTVPGVLGQAINAFQILAGGSPTSYSASGLPSGLSITDEGLISGTPKEVGVFPVEIRVANETGTARGEISIHISTDVSNPRDRENYYSLSVSGDYMVTRTSGSHPNLGWVIKEDGITVLKRVATNELSFRYYRNMDGHDYAVYLVSWLNGHYQRVSNIVGYSPGQDAQLPVISSSRNWVVEEGEEVTPYQIEASSNPTTYGVLGLPPGLSVNSTNGTISGTPTEPGTFPAMISAINSEGTATAELTITVAEYNPDPDSDGDYALTMSQNLIVSRSRGKYEDSVSWVVVKDGTVVLKRNAEGETQYRYYRNFVPGDYGIYLEASVDGESTRVSGIVGYRIVSSASTVQSQISPVLTSPRSIHGILGVSLDLQLESAGENVTYSATGLPPGLSVATSGRLFGMPSESGVYTATVVTDGVSGVVEANVKFFISEGLGGDYDYELVLQDGFTVARNPDTEPSLRWIVLRDDQREFSCPAASKVNYVYHRNYIPGMYEVYLEAWRGDAFERVSNIVNYETTEEHTVSGRTGNVLVNHAFGEVAGAENSFITPKFNLEDDGTGGLLVTFEYSELKNLAKDGYQLVVEYSVNAKDWFESTGTTSILGEDEQIEHKLETIEIEGNPSGMFFRFSVKPLPGS